MTLGLTVSEDARTQMLSELCERNHPAKLTYYSDDDLHYRAKVRFLHRSGDTLLLDIPVVDGRPRSPQPGECVNVDFVWKGQRFTLTCRVRGRDHYTLAGAESVPVLCVDVPQQLEWDQRRECYRLATVHIPSAVIILTPADEQGPPFEALLVDLSETGGGVLTDRDHTEAVCTGDRFMATFTLPEESDPMSLEAQVHWLQPASAGDRVRMGLGWQLDASEWSARQVQTRLGKYIMAEQQRALRRRRS